MAKQDAAHMPEQDEIDKKVKELKDNIALQLIELYKTSGLKWEDFCNDIGKCQSEASKAMNGKCNFTLESLVTMASGVKHKVVIRFEKIEELNNKDVR